MTGSPERALDRALEAGGFNLRGVLGAAAWDALTPPAWRCAELLPGARSAIVVASGGRALFDAFRGAPELGSAGDPLDRYTARVLGAAANGLSRGGSPSHAVLACQQRGGGYADFVALGRAAGLGGPSRLGLLLHPVYGPWMSIRGALLTALTLPASTALADFEPCTGCPAPCAAACHGAALVGPRFDPGACAATRSVEPACGPRCDARRACVLGPEHAYAEDAEAHHMRAAPPP